MTLRSLPPIHRGVLQRRRVQAVKGPRVLIAISASVTALGASVGLLSDNTFAAPAGTQVGGTGTVLLNGSIYTAMHRRPPKALIAEVGLVDQVLPPAREVLTLAESIRACTLGGARQLGKEKEIGSIEVGKKADLILLSQNLFQIKPEAIPATKVLATMFDGRMCMTWPMASAIGITTTGRALGEGPNVCVVNRTDEE